MSDLLASAATWRVLRAASIAFGLMWLVASISKAVAPLEPWEFASRAAGTSGRAAPWLALSLGAAAGIEAALGVAMILGAVRGFIASAAMLGIATAALLKVRHDHGGVVPCGCFSAFATSSVDGALTRNYVLIVVAVAAAVAMLMRDRALRSSR